MDNVTITKEVPLESWGFWKTCGQMALSGLGILHKYIILVLSVFFGLCLFVIFFHISQLKSQMIATIALRGADSHSRNSSEMREWYAIEVVQRFHALGIKDSEPYRVKKGVVPLPDLLSLNLGGQLFSGRPGERVRLVSQYPFSQANDSSQPMETFHRKALEFLNQNPEQSFYRVEEVDGLQALRFATAARMQQECVDCHNEKVESPKRNWAVGQVGGIIEIVYPLDSLEKLTGMNWFDSNGMMAVLVILWLGGFGLVVLKVRGISGELEQQVRQRTADLRESNRQLELEIYERHLAENTIRQARDNLEKRVQERTGKLAAANAELIREVAERKRAEDDIRNLNAQLVQRSAQLEASNKELEAFSYSVSHDLRAPLRGIDGFSQAVLEDYDDKLDESGRSYLNRVRAASQRMSMLIDAMLNLARLTRAEIHSKNFNISDMANSILDDLQKIEPDREVECVVADHLLATADPQLIRAVLENLLGNAWKFTRQHSNPRIEFGHGQYKGQAAFFVKDNGAGFDMTYAHKLFGAFQRLHAYTEFPGVGVGLATVHRIIQRHGGQIWPEGAVGEGATFYFTL
ncbi:MAG: ATP-binding protein [Nitrospirota bacterium]|nr:ATP-binding protein [Nitrospirota bacterium]MDH5585739.1 ATP-binding protein [Nitrospirota bacterium]MDH5774982.1 ATP-binding protein [Nitrospirota bacterium]